MLNRATTEIKKKYFKTKEFIAKKKQELPSIKLAQHSNLLHIHYPHEKCDMEHDITPR